MSEIILHGTPTSPFAEKVRLALGMKGLAWRSVTVPRVMPKPDLTALTGGYRRTPVMQIGSDIYCDTRVILAELDRRFPQPPLYPAGTAGEADIVGHWADNTLFQFAVSVGLAELIDDVPPAFRADREQLTGESFDPERLKAASPDALEQLACQLDWLNQMLAGQRFLLGDRLSAADLAAYHPLWFLRACGGRAAAAVMGWDRILGWMGRVVAVGYGQPTDMTPEEALEAARSSEPGPIAPAAAGRGRFEAGDAVTVTSDDHAKTVVAGTLVRLGAGRLVIARTDPRAGAVHVHLPVQGNRLSAAG